MSIKKTNFGLEPRNYEDDRSRSSLSVSAVDCYLSLPNSPSPSTLTLTPGRIRNIDQDMEALRASRQDNPFIQQLIASRESLIDSNSIDEESDNTNLMSKEFAIDTDVDPLSLPEMHEHMIRSPPPTTWPKSTDFNIFHFPTSNSHNQMQQDTKDKSKSTDLKSKHASWDGTDTSPFKSKSHHFYQDRFSLLTTNTLRSAGEDSIHLIAED